MHKSLEKFQPYVEKRLLRQVISPCKKLVLWNYTDACTYERAWDEVTLNARGTVYEIETGKVVARAFPKFFNFGEHQDEKKKQILNSSNFECFEKMDGSLGIIYYYGGEWRVNTRGSFTSDQAIKGKAILDRDFDTDFLMKSCTYLVEIIYPENKIIVDYGNEEKLVCLSAFNIDPEKEEDEVHPMFIGMDMAPSIKFDTIEALQQHLETLDHQEEGYVVRLENGERIKFKSAEYLRVARLINHMSPLSMWKAMENGKVNVDYLEHLPEEFREEADAIVSELEAKYLGAGLQINFNYNYTMIMIKEKDDNDLRRNIGIFCKENNINSGGVFATLDQKHDVIDKIIMKQIRPKANQIGG